MEPDSYVPYMVEQMAIGTEIAIYVHQNPLAIMNIMVYALEEANEREWSKEVEAMRERFMSEPDPE